MLRKLSITIFTLIFFFLPQLISGQNNELGLKTLVIDAGHGGKDPGTLIGDLKEKNIALDVALKLATIIREENPDVKVILTRDKDVFIPLDERANIANKAKADLFISIHVNYFKSGATNGSETYILGNHRTTENLQVAQLENSVILLEDDYNTRYEGFDPNSAESYIMFELIQNEFLEQSRFLADNIESHFQSVAKRRSRGVRQAGFLVLRKTAMPSILIELGFISNENDKQFLQTNNGRELMAKSIAQAFNVYKNRVDSRSNINISQKGEITESKPLPAKTETSLQSERKIEQTTKQASNNKKVHPIEEKLKEGSFHAIQILASKTEIPTNNEILSKFETVYIYKENGWYKYYVHPSKSYEETVKQLKLTKLEVTGVFPVSFINGEKLSFQKN